MSLFANRKLIELRLPSGKPGADGSKALCEYLDIASSDDVLLIISGKIDKQSVNSKWYKALDKAGITVQVWPVESKNLPRWLQQRVSSAGMSIDDEALQLLCDQVEGNLLAAVQEVEKLKLLATDSRITIQTVTEAVSDNARYNLFDMVDNALNGDAGLACVCCMGFVQRARSPQWYCGLWCGRFALCMKHNWIATAVKVHNRRSVPAAYGQSVCHLCRRR